MRWLWVIPDVRSFPSGGNVYNEQLTRALSDLGEVVIPIVLSYKYPSSSVIVEPHQ